MEDLNKTLVAEFGPQVTAEFVDALAMGQEEYPEVRSLLTEKKVNLPVILFNGEPYFHGSLSPSLVIKAIRRIQES